MKNTIRRFLSAVCAGALMMTAASALTAEQAVELLEQHYVNKIPEGVYEAQTLDEIFSLLNDPYTYYMQPQEYDDFLTFVEDTSQVVGIGTQIGFTAKGMEIVEVINGGPAEDAGLVIGDYIIAVNGVNCVPATEEMAELVRGEEGTDLTITVLREDGSVKDFSLTRRRVVINNTNFSVLDGRIGFINCSSFGTETSKLFQQGILKHDDEVDVWCLDLRGNAGGIATVAVETVGCFVGAGDHLLLRNAQDRYFAGRSYLPALTSDPVIVLTDYRSASASELLPADIRDYRAGISIGQRTVGKGNAQVVLTSENTEGYFGEDSMKVTAYRFYSSGGNTTDLIGVIPTIMLEEVDARRVATLLSATEPEDSLGWIGLRLGERGWYVNIEKAQSEQWAAVFDALLEALPPQAKTYVGLGGDSWGSVTPEYILSQYGLEAEHRWFEDVSGSDFENELNILATYRILRGMESGEFRPKEVMTRAQLSAMLAQALDITTHAPSAFSDVDDSDWYANDVMAMYLTGYMKGFEDGTFRPDEPVTNEQLITVIGKLAAFLNADLYDIASDFSDAELDDERLATYSAGSRMAGRLMLHMQSSGASLLYDELENIDPNAPVLREQAGATLCRLLTQTGIIFY